MAARVRPARSLALATASLLIAGSARAETMPQLDFGNRLLTAQVVWGAVIFAVFYLLVSRWALPRMGSVLELRSGTIAGELERAHASKAEADRAVAELTAARKQAYAQSQAEVAEATRKAKAEAAARTAEQDARLDAQFAASEAQIAQSRAAAMGSLRQVASETAVALVSRLTGGHADPVRVRDAVNSALAGHGGAVS